LYLRTVRKRSSTLRLATRRRYRPIIIPRRRPQHRPRKRLAIQATMERIVHSRREGKLAPAPQHFVLTNQKIALGTPTNPHPPLNRPPNRLHSLDPKPRAHLRRSDRRIDRRATNSPAVAHGPGELHRVGQDDGYHGHAGDIHGLRRWDCVFLREVVY